MGSIIASADKASKRKDVCKACEQYRRALDQCKVCGCIISIKTRLNDTSCPLGKWGKNSWFVQ